MFLYKRTMSDSSSDDDSGTMNEKKLCSIDTDGLVRSIGSNNYPVRFYNDSFVLHYANGIMMIYTNPMFVWRMIFSYKKCADSEREFDFQKLQLFVQRLGSELYMTNTTIEYNFDNIICFKPCANTYNIVHNTYSRLYMSVHRKYDQTEYLKQFLDSFILLLRYISGS